MSIPLSLPATLTSAQASACLNTLSAGLAQTAGGSAVVVDASALAHFDSSALAVLLELRRTCMAAGRSFAVRGLPERLGTLARLYGVATLLTATTATTAATAA